MYQEFNQHKKSDAVKWIIAFTLIIVLMAGVVAALILSLDKPTPIKPQENGTQQESIGESNAAVVLALGQPKRMSLKSPALAAENTQQYVSQTIMATVLPATAKNTMVDWSVEWGGSQTDTVTDYVTVTPESDGSTTATVTCKKQFTGEIVIICTTREGGYIATCTVTFAGHPTDIALSGSVSEVSGAYNLGIGTSYNYTATLTNPFNYVGSQFNEVSATVTGVGQIKVGYMEHYNKSGNDKWYDSSYSTIDFDSIKDSLISVSYSDGKLTINTLKAIESYYKSSQKLDAGRTIGYTDKFHSYVSDCYFNITLTEAKSGLTKTIKVVFDKSSITGVKVSSTEMEF